MSHFREHKMLARELRHQATKLEKLLWYYCFSKQPVRIQAEFLILISINIVRFSIDSIRNQFLYVRNLIKKRIPIPCPKPPSRTKREGGCPTRCCQEKDCDENENPNNNKLYLITTN